MGSNVVGLVARVGALGVLVVTRVLVVASLLDLGLIGVIVDANAPLPNPLPVRGEGGMGRTLSG